MRVCLTGLTSLERKKLFSSSNESLDESTYAVYMGTRCVACGYSLIFGDFRVTLVDAYAYKWLDHNSHNTTNANLASPPRHDLEASHA